MSNKWNCVAPNEYLLSESSHELLELDRRVKEVLRKIYPDDEIFYGDGRPIAGAVGPHIWWVQKKDGSLLIQIWLNERGDFESEHKYHAGDPRGSENRWRLMEDLCKGFDLKAWDDGWIDSISA